MVKYIYMYICINGISNMQAYFITRNNKSPDLKLPPESGSPDRESGLFMLKCVVCEKFK